MVVRTPLYVYTVYTVIFGCISSPLETRDGVVSVDSRAGSFDSSVCLSTCAAFDASETCVRWMRRWICVFDDALFFCCTFSCTQLILAIRRRVETRYAVRDGDATGVVIDDDDVDASRVVWVRG